MRPRLRSTLVRKKGEFDVSVMPLPAGVEVGLDGNLASLTEAQARWLMNAIRAALPVRKRGGK